MVKTVMSTMAMAMVAADDVTSLLQFSAGVRQSQGQRILAAVAEQGKDTICVQAVVGDVAPVTGSFTARMSQQAVVVAAGSVAGEAGSFCVAKQDVLLIQRTLGLNTAGDFEAALGSKNKAATTTTTTMDYTNFDFAGPLSKEVTVMAGECPTVQVGVVQTVEGSVSDKQEPAEKKLDADQLKVCACRNFLKSTVNTPDVLDELIKMQAALAVAPAEVLLQRNFDAALASKNQATTTTTTTLVAESAEFTLAKACTSARDIPGSWTTAAQELNNPKYADVFKSFNITGGWQHCNKHWVVRGACDAFVRPFAPCVYFIPNKRCVRENVDARSGCCSESFAVAGSSGTLPLKESQCDAAAAEAKCEMINQ